MVTSDPVIHITSEPNEYMLCEEYDGPGWYFINETWTDLCGPFDTELDARKALAKYARNL